MDTARKCPWDIFWAGWLVRKCPWDILRTVWLAGWAGRLAGWLVGWAVLLVWMFRQSRWAWLRLADWVGWAFWAFWSELARLAGLGLAGCRGRVLQICNGLSGTIKH